MTDGSTTGVGLRVRSGLSKSAQIGLDQKGEAMEVITPKLVPPPRAGRMQVFTCRCREVLRVWEDDLKLETIVFDMGETQYMAWFVCVSCGQKTYLSSRSQCQLIKPTGPDIPYK